MESRSWSGDPDLREVIEFLEEVDEEYNNVTLASDDGDGTKIEIVENLGKKKISITSKW